MTSRCESALAVALAIAVASCGSAYRTDPTSSGDRRPAVAATYEQNPNALAITRALVGTRAPGFALPVIGGPASGEVVSLADLAGHVVLVDFWAIWCTPCTAAVPHLDALQQRYAARGLRIIGLSGDAPDEIARFAAGHAISYTFAHDADDNVATAYKVSGLPMLVLIDKAGVIRYVGVAGGDLGAADRSLEAAIVDLMN